MKFVNKMRDKRYSPELSNGVRNEYMKSIDENGDPILVKKGEVNIDDFVNSFKDECLIENIIRRFENGDLNALNRAQGFYADITNLPSDVHDANFVLNYAKKVFENLNEDLRKDYPDFNAFVNAFSSNESLDKFISRFVSARKGSEKVDNGGDVNE